MKKITALLVSVFLLLNTAMLFACNKEETPQTDISSEQNQSETDENKNTETEDINMGKEKPQYLLNTLYALQTNKKLTVGYFGGSVTAGTGASDAKTTSWRGITNSWLKRYFYRATITEVNATIGNTGSAFGAYRVDEHLINKNPDLVFIEFAVNDTIDFVNGSRVYGSNSNYVYIETMLQKLYSANANVDIVFVLTGNFEYLKTEADGGEIFGQQYIDIAQYYNIPVIRVGTALAETIKAENGGVFPEKDGSAYPALWQKYAKSANDNVHPNDEGYKIYGDTVTAWLETQLRNGYTAMGIEEKDLPELTYCEKNGKGTLMSDACIVSPTAIKGNLDGFRVEDSGVDSTPHTLKSTTSGDEIEFTFNSSTFALWMVAPSRNESTYITYSIDGGAEKQLEIVYGSVRNHKLFVLAENLTPGTNHTIRIKHNDKNVFDCRQILLCGFGQSTKYLTARTM